MVSSTRAGATEQGNVAARQFGHAWVALTGALVLHVTDEALNDFLSVYNPTVLALEARFPWLRLPTFEFREWIAGLSAGVVLLALLGPAAYRGSRWLALVAVPFSVLMVANALGHIGSSVFTGQWMPGVYSSPVLLWTAVMAGVRARRVFE